MSYSNGSVYEISLETERHSGFCVQSLRYYKTYRTVFRRDGYEVDPSDIPISDWEGPLFGFFRLRLKGALAGYLTR